MGSIINHNYSQKHIDRMKLARTKADKLKQPRSHPDTVKALWEELPHEKKGGQKRDSNRISIFSRSSSPDVSISLKSVRSINASSTIMSSSLLDDRLSQTKKSEHDVSQLHWADCTRLTKRSPLSSSVSSRSSSSVGTLTSVPSRSSSRSSLLTDPSFSSLSTATDTYVSSSLVKTIPMLGSSLPISGKKHTPPSSPHLSEQRVSTKRLFSPVMHQTSDSSTLKTSRRVGISEISANIQDYRPSGIRTFRTPSRNPITGE